MLRTNNWRALEKCVSIGCSTKDNGFVWHKPHHITTKTSWKHQVILEFSVTVVRVTRPKPVGPPRGRSKRPDPRTPTQDYLLPSISYGWNESLSRHWCTSLEKDHLQSRSLCWAPASFKTSLAQTAKFFMCLAAHINFSKNIRAGIKVLRNKRHNTPERNTRLHTKNPCNAKRKKVHTSCLYCSASLYPEKGPNLLPFVFEDQEK